MEIFGEYDVVVVGGGVAGCAAAIASARAGANTILIEKLGALGSMMNVSGPPGWAFSHLWNTRGETVIAGLVEETHHRLEKEGHALPYPRPEDRHFNSFSFVDPDWWGLLIFEMMTENGVNLLLHSLAVDVLKEGDTVKGVIVENTSGRMAVLGKVIVECTGEGDIAARAGVPYTLITRKTLLDRKVEIIPPGLEGFHGRPGCPSITFHMDGVDWDKVTKYVKENLEEFTGPAPFQRAHWTAHNEEANKKLIEEFKNMKSILDLVNAGKLGTLTFRKLTQEALDKGDYHPYGDFGHYFTPREGGKIQAIFQHSAHVPNEILSDPTDVRELTAGEVECRRQVAIAIEAIRKYLPGFENSYFTRLTSYMRTREGRHMIGDYQLTSDDTAEARKFKDVIAKSAMGPMGRSPKDGGSYDIPYRSLVPKDVEGMLMAGKLASTSEEFKRDCLPDNIATGQAAGIAAAICARKGLTPRELEEDVSELQEFLQEQGAILF